MVKKITAFILVLAICILTFASCKNSDNNINDGVTTDTPKIQQPTCAEDTKSETISDDTVSEFIPNYKALGYEIKVGRIELQSQNVIFDKFDTTFDDPQTSRMTVERLEFEDTELYDENFFENRAVLKIMFSSSYADYSYYISHIHIDEGSITFGISRTVQAPDTLMNDMAGGKVFLVEMEKSKIEGINEFYAVDTTNHKTFLAEVNKGPRGGFSMDMNSKEFAMTCYVPNNGDYNEFYLKGSYMLDGEVLTLYDDESKLVFKSIPGGFAFEAEKSVVEENTTLVDGMLFKENESH